MSNKLWRKIMKVSAFVMLVSALISLVTGDVPMATYYLSLGCFNLLMTLTIFKDEP